MFLIQAKPNFTVMSSAPRKKRSLHYVGKCTSEHNVYDVFQDSLSRRLVCAGYILQRMHGVATIMLMLTVSTDVQRERNSTCLE